MKTRIVLRTDIEAKARLSLLEHIAKALPEAFCRERSCIQEVSVSINDINGKRGGQDKECQILLRTNVLRTMIIKDVNLDEELAFRSALKRAKFQLRESLQKKAQQRKKKRSRVRALKEAA